jgi:acetylornithine/N-succinyldiaminopimelate aminotransferase
MNQAELLALASQRLYPNYRPAPFVLSRGKGCEVWDVEGKRYLDMAAGVAVCTLGHAHPAYVAAVSAQVAKLGHVSNWFYNEENVLLADELCRLSGFDRAMFCNSGAEALEGLFKLARHHFFGKGEPMRTRFLAFDNAFHGRTMGALSLTGTPKYREGFGEVAGVTHVPYGDLGAVREALTDEFAAVVVEPIQGEGGVLPAPEGFLAGLRAACDARGALLLFDEVQTGVGRTGAWFGFQRAGVAPDAVALAKGLGGGFPIGAILTREALAGALPPGTHGSTYAGNPLGCAAARAVLAAVAAEGLVEGARAKGEHLAAALRGLIAELPGVCEAERGEGLLRGLVLAPGLVARDVVARAAVAGLLLTGAGARVVRFVPPLVVTEAELTEAVALLKATLQAVASERGG